MVISVTDMENDIVSMLRDQYSHGKAGTLPLRLWKFNFDCIRSDMTPDITNTAGYS